MALQAEHPQLHSLMRLQEYGGMVVLQPCGEDGVSGRSLTCDLQTGKMTLADAVDKMLKGFTTIYGIMGIVKLQTGCVLVAVTGARKVKAFLLMSCSCLVSSEGVDQVVYFVLLLLCVQSIVHGAGSHSQGMPRVPSN